MSWTSDHAEAKKKWDVFWSRSVASQERRAELKALEYQQLYSLLTGYGVGPATPKDAANQLDGFDDEGVGYKDEVKREPSACPPMPVQRSF